MPPQMKSFSGLYREISMKQDLIAGYELEIQSVGKIKFYCGVAIRRHLASQPAGKAEVMRSHCHCTVWEAFSDGVMGEKRPTHCCMNIWTRSSDEVIIARSIWVSRRWTADSGTLKSKAEVKRLCCPTECTVWVSSALKGGRTKIKGDNNYVASRQGCPRSKAEVWEVSEASTFLLIWSLGEA